MRPRGQTLQPWLKTSPRPTIQSLAQLSLLARLLCPLTCLLSPRLLPPCLRCRPNPKPAASLLTNCKASSALVTSCKPPPILPLGLPSLPIRSPPPRSRLPILPLLLFNSGAPFGNLKKSLKALAPFEKFHGHTSRN